MTNTLDEQGIDVLTPGLHDDVGDTTYRKWFDELREVYMDEDGNIKNGLSLDAFRRKVSSVPSKGQWSKYDRRGSHELKFGMRNELRVAANLFLGADVSVLQPSAISLLGETDIGTASVVSLVNGGPVGSVLLLTHRPSRAVVGDYGVTLYNAGCGPSEPVAAPKAPQVQPRRVSTRPKRRNITVDPEIHAMINDVRGDVSWNDVLVEWAQSKDLLPQGA